MFCCRSEEPGFFDGVFLSQDSEVSSFVEEVRGAVKSVSFQSGWAAGIFGLFYN